MACVNRVAALISWWCGDYSLIVLVALRAIFLFCLFSSHPQRLISPGTDTGNPEQSACVFDLRLAILLMLPAMPCWPWLPVVEQPAFD